AQAVVSRTYAIFNKTTNANERFDLVASVLDQVYGGKSVESPESNRAVDDTRGQVLLDTTGKPFQAFFHSSCGGHTELPDHVWKSSETTGVFAVVSDGNYCEDDPHYKWHLTIALSTIRNRLRHAGFRARDIKTLSILQKSSSGRAEIFNVQTSKGEVM